MIDLAPQLPSQCGAHLVLYDGVCGLCTCLVQFLLLHDHRRVFSFASLQGAAGRSIIERSGGRSAELSSFCVVADHQTPTSRVLTRSDAALFVAGELGWPWKTARLMRCMPKGVRDRAYDLFARHRYQLFGRYDRCLTPSPAFRGRFID